MEHSYEYAMLYPEQIKVDPKYQREIDVNRIKNKLKAEVRQELECPREFIVHLDFWKTFDELKEAILSGNRDERDEIMDQIRDCYRDYCSDTGLDPMKNNRRKTPGYFLYTMGGNHA